MTKTNDDVPTPPWLMRFFGHCYDPCPVNPKGFRSTDGRANNPPKGVPIFLNPPYSEKDKWLDWAIQQHQNGHAVAMLIPFESSTQFGKRLLTYGVQKMYFDRRIFPRVRGVELVILTGDETHEYINATQALSEFLEAKTTA